MDGDAGEQMGQARLRIDPSHHIPGPYSFIDEDQAFRLQVALALEHSRRRFRISDRPCSAACRAPSFFERDPVPARERGDQTLTSKISLAEYERGREGFKSRRLSGWVLP